jgi:hypothetical protein
MQNPDRFVRGWRVVFGYLMAARHLSHWLFPVLILALALGIGIAPSTWVIQAQDQTGQGDEVTYHLDYQRTPQADPICIGQTLQLSAVMIQSTRFSGERIPHTGHALQTLRATAINTRVLAPRPGLEEFLATYVPLGTRRREFTFEAREAGTTSIEIDARVLDFANTSNPAGDYFPYHASIRVQVVPCEYQVNIQSIWVTSMHGASTVLIANAHNLRMTGPDRQNFTFEPPLDAAPFLEWTWANNRIIGCNSSSGTFSTQAPAITATIRDDQLAVTINYARAVPGGPNSQYYRNLCLPHFSGEPCSDHPDGYCWTMPVNRPFDWFEPQRLQPPALLFPLNGGSLNARHLIIHSWGPANGTAIITVVPVPVQ